jgi:dihydrofolate reductase
MSKTVLYMSMSLDGYCAGPRDSLENPFGDGGERLHDWLRDEHGVVGRPQGVNGRVVDEFMATGSVIVGRTTFEQAREWGGEHHDGVPIFVFTQHAGDTPRWPRVTYVDDIADAATRAKEAAGSRNVLVHGEVTARMALAAGVLDEMEISVVPVLFGDGHRMFLPGQAEQTELEITRVLEGEKVTHIRYRVRPGDEA